MQQPPTSGGAGGDPVTCQICGAANPPGAAACQVCHANLMSDSLRCQMCGGVSPPGSEACMVCGASLVQRSGPAAGPAADPAASAAPPTTDEEDGRRCACGALNPLAAPACIVCGTRLFGPIAYQLIGTLMPALEIGLEPGQGVYAQTHCLGWMTETVQMRTLARGSPWALLGRVASGMTMLVSHFRTPTTPGIVAFTPHLPGRIMPLELNPGGDYVLQPGAFLAAQDSVSLHPFFNRNLGAGLFGGEGFILQRLSGHGMAFVQIGGEMVEYDLRAGEVLLVDPGSLALFDATVRFSVRMVRGITNIMFSQGLFLGELRGPGRVWMETMPMSRLMAAISSRIAVTPAAGVRGAISGITSVLGS